MCPSSRARTECSGSRGACVTSPPVGASVLTGSVDVSAFGKLHDYAGQRPPMHARRGRCPRVREVPLVRETVYRRTCEPVEAPIARVPPRPS